MKPVYHPRAIAAATPEKPALIIVDQDSTITYGELVRRSDQAGHLLASLGIQPGDTIAIMMENHIRYPELIWGAKNSGIRYVAVSTHLNGSDAAYVIDDSGATLLITSKACALLAAEAIAGLAIVPKLLMIDGAAEPFMSYEALLADQPETPITGKRRGPSMLYSSGTTGRPKGVRTEFPDAPPETPPQRLAMLIEQYGFGPDTVFINPGPYYHAAPGRMMVSIHRTGGTVIGFRTFDPAQTLEAIGAYGGTHGFFVPTMFGRLLGLPENIRAAGRPGTMRHAIHGAAPCPMHVKRAMIDWWGPVISELYGGTEAFGHTFITSEEWLTHPGSVGKPANGCTLRITDADGNEVPAGLQGRIMMKNGMNVAYHGDAAKTAELYDDTGFASLGDIGYVDTEGYLYLTDRESHMIIVGGVNVYPQEAENVLLEHPAIADVAVIGVPDADMGEAIKGVVQLNPDRKATDALAQQIIAFCRARLSLHKCPRSIDFVLDLPRNDAGKLVKRMLREQYWKAEKRMI
jgi:acyl-CoA synthetase (AMP-forming)/AMP-acid ligase II